MKTTVVFPTILALGTLLTACPTTPTNSDLGQTPTITGTIAGWKDGVKAIQLEYPGFKTIAPIPAGNIAANGSFSVTLPVLPSEKLDIKKAFNCTSGTNTVSPSGLATASMYLVYYNDPNNLNIISSVTQTKSLTVPNPTVGLKIISAYRQYANLDGSIIYNNCQSDNIIYKSTINYKSGWNEVFFEVEILAVANGKSTSLSITYGNGTKNQPWQVLTEQNTTSAF